MKTLLKIVAVLVVLFIILMFVAVASLDKMIKTGVESIGPEVTGTTVKLDGVELSLLDGRGRLTGLVIGNPQGFQTPQAFKLGDARVKVDLKSLLTDKLIIEEIVIDAPDITYEQGSGGSNLAKLQSNVASFGGTKEQAGSQTQKQDPTRKRVQINNFILKNAKVNASAPALQLPNMTMPLPDIHLRDIGKEAGGTTVQKAANQVFTAINTAAIQSVAKSGKFLEQGTKMAEDAAKRLGGEAGKTGTKALDDATKGLGGLFK